MRKWYKNETRGLEILKKQEIELKIKKTKNKDRIEEYKILIETIIGKAEDLKIRVINKLNEMKKITTKINELEKKKLWCISMTERLYGY